MTGSMQSLLSFALSPLRRHFACEAETEQNSKKCFIERGVLLLAACLHQGSDKDKEEEKPREQEETVSETPRGEAEMSMVAANTASPAKAVALVEKPRSTMLDVKRESQYVSGIVSSRRRHYRQQRPFGTAVQKLKNLTAQQKVF